MGTINTCNDIPNICCVVYVGRDGVYTLLLEKKKFPRDKYCGDAVCKTGIEILQDMGIYTELIKQNKAKVVSISYYVWYIQNLLVFVQ